MKLTAVFESWHIDDGNYPPLSKGQHVNLSFAFEPSSVHVAPAQADLEWTHIGDAKYEFVGRVTRVYDDDDIVVTIQAEEFQFYMTTSPALDKRRLASLREGDMLYAAGTLVLDPYTWVEFLDSYPNPPDLFLSLKVTGIRKIQTPGRFVRTHKGVTSWPTRLEPHQYDKKAVEWLDTMLGQPFDEEFYLLDFDSDGMRAVEVSRTFI